jgi:hypothetical protein
MQLGDFRVDAFSEFANYRIEDAGFFLIARNRAIESTGIIICFFAMSQEQRLIDEPLVIKALSYVNSNTQDAIRSGSSQAVISTRHVEDFARAPAHLEYTDGAREAIARYLNFYLVMTLAKAATAASRDPSFRKELPTIKVSHILASCDDLPYPLNLWLC